MATRLRILFVDDEANPDPSESVLGNYMSFYEAELTEEGHDVTVAQDFRSGVEALKSSAVFDCAIIDLHMPGKFIDASLDPMGGIELAQWIVLNRPLQRVIVLTNVTDQEVLDQIPSLSCVRLLLHKHLCRPSQLAACVRRVASSPS